MQDSSTDLTTVLQFRQDLHGRLRDHIREAIETTIDEELAAALGSSRHERTGARTRYRHGAIERTVTTAEGTAHADGPSRRGCARRTARRRNFRARSLPRYARRTREVDEALLGCYLGGINSRRIAHGAADRCWATRHLSKSAVSRVVARLKTLWTTWEHARSEPGAVCDRCSSTASTLRVRLARRVVMRARPRGARGHGRRGKNSWWRCAW